MSAPCLFLPGTLCDERVWLPVWRQLQISQRRYVPLQWATSMNDMLALTGDRVLPDEKVHLIGFSMGGYIAAKWASENSKQVASLTLIASSPAGLTDDEVKRRKQMLAMLKKGQFHPDKPGYLERFVHPDSLNDDNVAGVVTEMGKDLGVATFIAHTESTTPRPSLLSALKSAPFDIHIIAASADKMVTTTELQHVADTLPSAKLTVIDDAAHMCLLEKPAQIAELLQPVCK